jgi:photosystem II stability/assembly factor-like uncharacterized protein
MRFRVLAPALVPAAILLETLGVAPAPGEPSWQALPSSPVVGTYGRCDDVWFFNERIGWTGLLGTVYRTVDGGSTWKAFETSPRLSAIRCIAFTTASRGWIGSVVDSIALWATADSGTTWVPVELPAPKPRGICGLSLVGTSVVYGSGAWYGTPTLVKSTDGGASWKSIDLSGIATGLVDCHFFSPDSGFVVGRVGTGWLTDWRALVLFTPDGGTTWETRYTGTHLQSLCWKISFPSRRVGYISVESFDNATPTHCLKTVDGGNTWREVVLTPTGSIDMQGIGFVNEQVGWAGGGGGMFSTTDGGVTWVPVDWGMDVNRFRFLGPNLGFASGHTIYKYSEPNAVEPSTFTRVKRMWR